MNRLGEHGVWGSNSGQKLVEIYKDNPEVHPEGSATQGAEALVILENVHKRFGRQEVLKGIDLELKTGRITGLLGPSGCGKTTLINLIVGSLVATSGKITVFGKDAPPRSVRREMGFMPQSEALYNDLTARENLRFFGALYGLSGKQLEAAIPRVLGLVHLEDQGKKVVGSFSGGMKRRLSLAIALLHSPRLLILDEPTVGLDPLHRIGLWKSFHELVEGGATMLITTHVMDEAALCDHIIMLHDGQIIARGTAQGIIAEAKTSTLEEAFLKFETQGSIQPQQLQQQKEAGKALVYKSRIQRKNQAPSHESEKEAHDV